MTRRYAVTVELTLFQEMEFEEVEADTPEKAQDAVEEEMRKIARRIRVTADYDTRTIDYDWKVASVKEIVEQDEDY